MITQIESDNYKWVKVTKIQIHDDVTKTMHKYNKQSASTII